MKLKFEKNDDLDIWNVSEEGISTKKIKFEFIGWLDIHKSSLVLHEDYSGILGLDEMKQIIEFAKLVNNVDEVTSE